MNPASFRVEGYPAYLGRGAPVAPDTTTDAYAHDQGESNPRKTLDFLIPILDDCGARRVCDVGCGTGTMVQTLVARGYDAFGVDLVGLARRWAALDLPRERFGVIDPDAFALPFADGELDLVFSLGAIEHVGTVDGHARRSPQYQAVRAQWLRELYRTVRPGGFLLVGGPNRQFPVDAAHGPDHETSALERTLSRWARVTIHKPWGDNFLWSYSDVAAHLAGLPFTMRALRVDQYLGLSRVPARLRPLVQRYLAVIPERLLATGLNPYVMALVQRH